MKIDSQRARRRTALLDSGFLPFEAYQLSKLPKRTPALRILMTNRDRFLSRFSKRADRRGWSKTETKRQYRMAVKKLYERRGWLVQEGPKGKQKGPRKGKPNPWAMYRDAVRSAPGKGYVSPWEKRQLRGKTALDRGQIFIKKAEKSVQSGDQVQTRQWIAELEQSIREARGTRKQELQKQLGRLKQRLNRQGG